MRKDRGDSPASCREARGTWSPDGATVAFTSDRSGNYEIWTTPVVPPVSMERAGWAAIKGRFRAETPASGQTS
ncbi:MAG TPA: hypothetical protein VKU85_16050 [bacterium]|nr:hypothetical protein [bacterium]